MYLPRRLGTPARPHQLFLALGGTLTLDEVLNPGATDGPTWRFRVDIRSDAGAALLIDGDGVQPNATRSRLGRVGGLPRRARRDRDQLRPAARDRDAARDR